MTRRTLHPAVAATVAGILIALAGSGDAAAGVEDAGSDAKLPSSQDPPVCVDSGHRIVAVLSYGSDGPIRDADTVRNRLARMNWKVKQQAQLSGGPPLELKMECDAGGQVKIYESVSDGETAADWRAAASDLFEGPDGRLPKGADAIKILVFRAEIESDAETVAFPETVKSASDDPADSPGSFDADESNHYRVTSMISVAAVRLDATDPWGDHTALHELFHAMGAVAGQDVHSAGFDDPAPFANGNGHCNDGIDLICYAFGNPTYTNTRCPLDEGFGTPEGLPIDCGYDTYFDAAPEPGEWLDRHWNVGGAENPYLYRPPAWAQVNRTRLASKVEDVHCVSANACVGVGSEVGPEGRKRPFAAHWDGSDWAKRPMPSPSGSVRAVLTGVSCVSATSCVAVGTTSDVACCLDSSSRAFAMHWDGSSWTAGSLPTISGSASHRGLAVSCYSGGCTAVGGHRVSGMDKNLGYRWNGTSWTTLTVPPTGSTGNGLRDVYCASSSSCRMLGWKRSSGVTSSVLMLYAVGVWGHSSIPALGGAGWSELTDLSCVGASCVAVGQWFEPATGLRKPLVAISEASDGWTVSSPPVPSDATRSGLSGVACTSSSSCVAVGGYVNSAGIEVPLGESWDGDDWSSVSIPKPAGATAAALSGVSCASQSACLAAGVGAYSSGDFLVASELDGGGWSDAGNGVPDAEARAVSCAQPKACVSVGDSDGDAVARSWNGDRWSGMPVLTSAADGSLESVHCTATDACVAVGSRDSGSEVLVERWNGIHWATQSAPEPSGSTHANLEDVWCASASACVAVGSHVDAAGAESPLAEVWDGSSWTIQGAVPVPAGATTAELTGVSCNSASACTAVGVYDAGAGERYFAVRRNGSTWTPLSAMPSASTSARLDDVVCSSQAVCSMVGSSVNSSGNRQPLHLTWGFGVVVTQLSPAPTGAASAQLTDVSQGNGTTVAVGSYVDAAGNRKGYASRSPAGVELTPNAPAQSSSELTGVSCTVAGTCVAAGRSTGLGTDRQPLYVGYE
ncbi:MAG TPA: hypothetical protein VHF90_07750 [Thermoleophilaceae bacterium]|nr:hypothetical protein [Thermoleophilaceae bacterium]